ncbi:hypothetical protein pipiens_015416 [Culex pipiens pipiens]|uniref:Uncharacterized protein n=1 Tax=Culex pipiens pipiens TaxID=38569 RepID=A0ABD1CQM9_CULPP
MVNKILLLAAICLGAASANDDYGFLQVFNSNFSSLSREVEFELQGKREFNGLLIREFNREILNEFGEIVPRMRGAHYDFLQYVQNFDGASEECRDYVFFLADLYRYFQEWDIQDCAYLTYLQLRADALYRFIPVEQEYARENARALFQDELDYYTNLREYYRQRLNEELAKHGEDAHETINMLESCRYYIYFWQDDDHDYLRQFLESDCQ